MHRCRDGLPWPGEPGVRNLESSRGRTGTNTKNTTAMGSGDRVCVHWPQPDKADVAGDKLIVHSGPCQPEVSTNPSNINCIHYVIAKSQRVATSSGGQGSRRRSPTLRGAPLSLPWVFTVHCFRYAGDLPQNAWVAVAESGPPLGLLVNLPGHGGARSSQEKARTLA